MTGEKIWWQKSKNRPALICKEFFKNVLLLFSFKKKKSNYSSGPLVQCDDLILFSQKAFMAYL